MLKIFYLSDTCIFSYLLVCQLPSLIIDYYTPEKYSNQYFHKIHFKIFIYDCNYDIYLFQLYNVVVDTEVTSKKLLQKGRLQQRTTFIPLNKICASKMDNNTIRFAQQLVSCSK